MKIISTGFFCLALCAAAAPAHAQTVWTDKGFANATVGLQVGSQDLGVATPFDIYGETGTVTSILDVKSGGFFDLSAGYKVWRNLALGAGYTWTDASSDAAVTATVPDPLVFDQPRTVTTTAEGIKHQEQAIHLTGTWMVPVTEKVDVGIAFGPTIFLVNQDVPSGVEVSEPGPAINRVNSASFDESTVGFHLGVDVTYLITPRIGVGGLARFARGSVDIENAEDGLNVGGFQIGVGARFRF